MVDYYMSVSEAEAGFGRPVYSANHGLKLLLDANATVPITTDWLFRAGFSYEKFSSAIADSPLAEDDKRVSLWMGCRYVW